MGIISIAIRSGICVYAVKYTVDQGAWGDADKAITFKNNTCKAVNGNEYVKTGKAHFQTYVPMPQVSSRDHPHRVFHVTHIVLGPAASEIVGNRICDCSLLQPGRQVNDKICGNAALLCGTRHQVRQRRCEEGIRGASPVLIVVVQCFQRVLCIFLNCNFR